MTVFGVEGERQLGFDHRMIVCPDSGLREVGMICGEEMILLI